MIPEEMLIKIDEVIKDPKTLAKSRISERYFTRKRKMPFSDALYFFLDMEKTSLQSRLDKYQKVRKGEKMSEQAFSSARNKFNHYPFETMHRELVVKEYTTSTDIPTWNGYHLLAVDGSYLQLPKNDELRSAFGVRGEGGLCVSAGNSTLYDVLSGWPIDPALTHSDMNERDECEKHIEYLCSELPQIASKSILLLDRGYPSMDLLRKLDEKGIKYLVRCSKKFCLASKNAPMGNSIIVLNNGLRVRVYKFALPSGETKTLLTNLFVLPCESFPELYSKRWGIETYYDKLKNIICIEKFSGRTQNAIRQDFWASMVLMIAVAVFQKAADKQIGETQSTKSNKHTYKAKTSDLVVTLRNRFIFHTFMQNNIKVTDAIQDIVDTVAYSKSPVRPGRAFPRRHNLSLASNDNLKSHL